MLNKPEMLTKYLISGIDEIMHGFAEDTKNEIEQNDKLSRQEQNSRKILIDVKINHSKRVAQDLKAVFNDRKFDSSWGVLGYFIGQLHDIGRFLEGEHANSFNPYDVDVYYANDFAGTEYAWVKEHASLGTALLINKEALNEIWTAFKLSQKQKDILNKVVGMVISNHQKDSILGDNLKIDLTGDETILRLNIFDLLINEKLSEHDLNRIIAFYSDLIRDIDKIDILYQHLTGEFPVLRNTMGYPPLNENLDEIAAYWGITCEEILAVNSGVNQNLEKNGKRLELLQIPITALEATKLAAPKDVEDMFYSNTIAPKLQELQDRRDWTPLTGMLWRLSTFIGQARFTGTLKSIKQSNLLEKILATYPAEYQEYLAPYFKYSEQMLMDNLNNNDLYVDNSKARKQK
jgi:hypothetical protein